MRGLVRELRLVPVVLFAAVCLLALKVLGIVVDGGYVLGDLDYRRTAFEPSPGKAATSGKERAPWAREMFNFPDGPRSPAPAVPRATASSADITGSIAAEKQAEKNQLKVSKAPAEGAAPAPDAKAGNGAGNGGAKSIPVDGTPVPSAGERAVLERLQDRRQELDTRARELEIRENLLKSAEKQLETRIGELKELELRIKAAMQQKDDADTARFKGLVTMYENMRAKDAARIFDRLELKVLIDVASQINPRRMSDILALMQPETAERLTIELANRASAVERTPSANDLPKIEGRPTQ